MEAREKSTLPRSPSSSKSLRCASCHTPARPLREPAPSRNARQTELFSRQHLPGNPAAQDKDDGLQRSTVICPGTVRLVLQHERRQQRRYALPESIRNELSDHVPLGGHGLLGPPSLPALSLGVLNLLQEIVRNLNHLLRRIKLHSLKHAQGYQNRLQCIFYHWLL